MSINSISLYRISKFVKPRLPREERHRHHRLRYIRSSKGTCRRPLLEINRNIPNTCGTPKSGYDGNCKHSTTGSTHHSGAALKNDSPQHVVAPSLRGINNLSFSGAGCPNGGTQNVTTPS